MPAAPLPERVAFSPGEFASLFGKSQTWGYRQIYAGKVKAITEHGRILIPAKEVERVLESAGIYNGKEKPKAQKARLGKLPAEHRSVWQRFIDSRRGGGAEEATSKGGGQRRDPGPTGREKAASTVKQRVAKSWHNGSAAS